jgi:hypothetical protein
MEDNKPRIIKKRYIFMSVVLLLAGIGLEANRSDINNEK